MNKPSKKQMHKIVWNRETNILTYLRFSLKHRPGSYYDHGVIHKNKKGH